jgi:hypothetical protein
MLVTNLEYMEKIVSSRNDLEWNGWDIVKYTRSESAMFSPEGVFKNGVWCKRKTFPITTDGWFIPNSMREDFDELER